MRHYANPIRVPYCGAQQQAANRGAMVWRVTKDDCVSDDARHFEYRQAPWLPQHKLIHLLGRLLGLLALPVLPAAEATPDVPEPAELEREVSYLLRSQDTALQGTRLDSRLWCWMLWPPGRVEDEAMVQGRLKAQQLRYVMSAAPGVKVAASLLWNFSYFLSYSLSPTYRETETKRERVLSAAVRAGKYVRAHGLEVEDLEELLAFARELSEAEAFVLLHES